MTTKTKLTDEQVAELAKDLSEDGDTVELPDGRTLRLRVEPDDVDMRDFEDDFYGQTAPANAAHWREFRPTERPNGFTGNAEKLWPPQNCDPVWWEPPKDGPKRGTIEFQTLRSHLADLLAFGYYYYAVELLDDTDAYGRGVVRNVASLGGIEPFADREYVAEIVTDLIHEVMS